LRQLAELVQGEVDGDGNLVIQSARALHEALPGDITFADDRHFEELHHSPASAAVVSPNGSANGKSIIRVQDPIAAFATIFQRLRPVAPRKDSGIHPTAVIDPSAVIGSEAHIGPHVCVGAGTIIGSRCRLHSGVVIGGGCRLGDDAELYPHAVLYDGTVIGDSVIIHANAVIGADGFGYRSVDGEHVKVPQLGHVEIGDRVEIGAGTTIDRGTFGPTRIGAGTKIDNLVQIGHNCQIGDRNIIVAQAGVAGSSRTGNQVVVAAQAGIRDHVEVGDGCVIAAKAGVSKDIQKGEFVCGAPAIPLRDFKLINASMSKLPELRRLVMRIKKHLGLEDEGA
jgi:UDP-3-O-[3-hydroxymyristoyl] glucosamine N-acyltransferase